MLWNIFASDTWFRFIIFLMESWNGTKIRVSGDKLPDSENVLLISNHPSEADWFFLWSLGWRKKSLGNVKVCIKKELQKVPGLGWSIDNLDYPFLSRKWEFDEALIKHATNNFVEDRIRLWLAIFPEGTDFSEAKQKRSWELADINGWPKYKNLLAPRTKGFVLAVTSLRDYVDCIYDLTVGYPNNEKPTFFTALNGRCPSVVNIHIRRIPMKNVPETEEELKKWCFDKFSEKDVLLDYFKQHQKFPGAGDEFLSTGPGLPPFFAWLWWTGMVLLSAYGIYTSRLVLAIFVVGWVIFASFAHSKRLRRWRGLDPPLESHTKQQ